MFRTLNVLCKVILHLTTEDVVATARQLANYVPLVEGPNSYSHFYGCHIYNSINLPPFLTYTPLNITQHHHNADIASSVSVSHDHRYLVQRTVVLPTAH